MGGRSTMAPRPPRPAAARSPPERCTDIIGDEHVDDCGTVVPTNDWFYGWRPACRGGMSSLDRRDRCPPRPRRRGAVVEIGRSRPHRVMLRAPTTSPRAGGSMGTRSELRLGHLTHYDGGSE
jgi:hypothetical protein